MTGIVIRMRRRGVEIRMEAPEPMEPCAKVQFYRVDTENNTIILGTGIVRKALGDLVRVNYEDLPFDVKIGDLAKSI